jgi:hypothetical protein
MTKDDFQKAAREMNSKAPAVKKDTAGASSAKARPPQPSVPGPLVPKAPFGMPSIPIVQARVVAPAAAQKKSTDLKESDPKDME